ALLPLSCSATGDPASQISAQDVGGSSGVGGAATSLAGSAGTSTGFGPSHPLTDPNSNAGSQMMPIGGVSMRGADPGGCTKDQNILFLIDRSGSMQCNPPPTTQSFLCELAPSRADATMPSKLEIVEQALSGAFNQLRPTMMNQPKTRAGLAILSTDDMW